MYNFGFNKNEYGLTGFLFLGNKDEIEELFNSINKDRYLICQENFVFSSSNEYCIAIEDNDSMKKGEVTVLNDWGIECMFRNHIFRPTTRRGTEFLK